MAFMAALNFVFALVMLSRHCGTPVHIAFIKLVATGVLHASAAMQHSRIVLATICLVSAAAAACEQ